MTRVDFYVLAEASEEDAVPTVCRLCDKACSAEQRVYIAVADAELTRRLDDALWSFRQGSFIAHELMREQAPEPPLPAVLLGGMEPPDDYSSILVNLCPDVPACFSRFERVLEIVCGDAPARQKSRERYRYYRDRGYPLASHPL
jgi:DNA polymerase-3 subunit chi